MDPPGSAGVPPALACHYNDLAGGTPALPGKWWQLSHSLAQRGNCKSFMIHYTRALLLIRLFQHATRYSMKACHVRLFPKNLEEFRLSVGSETTTFSCLL